MILLQAAHIYKSFGATEILQDVNITVKDKERVGLVGVNGVGKSTLLKILCGKMYPDQGQVNTAKGATLGYLAQDGGMESTASVWEEMLSAFNQLLQQEDEIRQLEQLMGTAEVLADEQRYKKVSDRYATLSEQFRLSGGYTFRANIRAVLYGLKFLQNDFDIPVSKLSGGQKTRLALAKLLTQQPDILILDEPTNFLDMDSVSWLEKYLHSYSGAILMVSHDRFFLDSLAGAIYEMEFGKATRFNGNYSKFLELKKALLAEKEREFRKYEEKRNQLADFVQKNIARAATSGRAKARQKQLEKMDTVQRPVTEVNQGKITIEYGGRSGNDVLSLTDLAVGYTSHPVAKELTLEVNRGQRVALLGANGMGKTTLLRTIAGELDAIAGDIRLGFNVQTAYFRQEQDVFGNQTVLDELWDRYPGMEEAAVRKVLGRFLFHGDEVFKSVADLSGGEKARLALAALMCRQANFLMLDEPTNHLDYSGREALEDALMEFPGTLMFVSHDRYFINKIANRIIELTPQGINDFQGNYHFYLAKKEAVTADNAAAAPKKQETDNADKSAKSFYLRAKENDRNQRKKQRRLQELETLTEDIQQRIAALEGELSNPAIADYTVYQEKGDLLANLQKELDGYLEEWVTLEDN